VGETIISTPEPQWVKEITDRPLILLGLGLASGIGLGQALSPGLARAGLALGLALLCLGGLALARARPRQACLAWLLAGLSLGFWRCQPMLARLESPGFERQAQVRLTGRVHEDLGVAAEDGRAALVLDQVQVDQGPGPRDFPGMVRLGWEACRAPGPFGTHDRVACVCSLRSPEPPDNPGEFDQRRYLLGRGVTALASAHFASGPRRIAQGGAWDLARWAWRLRQGLLQGLSACLPPPQVRLAAACSLGDRRGLPRREVEGYARSGLAFLMAVAGLHLALALALFLSLLRLITPSRRLQACGGLALGLAYVLACGCPVPALRAGALVLLMLLGRIFDLETDAGVSLAAGALGVLLLQPWALAEAGFQMSFGVTACLMFSRPLQQRLKAWMPGWLAWLLALSLAVQAACLPLAAWHFHTFSWPGLFSGQLALLLLPAIISLSLLCAPLAWLWPPLAAPLALPLAWACKALDQGAALLSRLPGAAWSCGQPSPAWMLAWAGLVLVVAWIVLHRRRRPWLMAACGAGLALLLAGRVAAGLPHPHPGLTRAYALAVGQGDGILLEFPDGRTLLVDGGPGHPDAGSYVVQPALRSLGISRLDGVAFTHADADHLGGLEWVLDQVPCGRVYETGLSAPQDYQPSAQGDSGLLRRVRGLVRSRRLAYSVLRAGDRMPGFPEVKVLWPPRKGWALKSPRQRNDQSLVLDVEGWLLLTGDLGKAGEKALLKAWPGLGRRSVLKLGHHGSAGASSAAFLARLRPSLALVSAGRNNRFGFPRAQVLARLPPNCALARTDLQGCLRLEHGSGDQVELACWRRAGQAELWQAPGAQGF
jgi:competence protein ComEC